MNGRLPSWACPALIAVLLLGAGALYLYAEGRDDAADRQGARADSAIARADSIEEEARELRRRREVLAARLDSTREREEAVRDSLRRALTVIDSTLEVAAADVEAATVGLDSTLVELKRKSPPRLQPLVSRALAQADSLESNVDRLRAGYREKVSLLEADTASLKSELLETRAFADSVVAEADSAWRVVDAKNAAIAELEAEVDLLREPWYAEVFGRGVVEVASTVVVGGAVCYADPKGACLGFAAEKGRQLLVEAP